MPGRNQKSRSIFASLKQRKAFANIKEQYKLQLHNQLQT